MASGNVNVSCTIVYADHPTRGAEINAVMNCTANGQFYNAIAPTRTLDPSNTTQYMYSCTPYIVVNNTGPATYDCLVTFAAPIFGFSGLVMNAPDFSVTRRGKCSPIHNGSLLIQYANMVMSITFAIVRFVDLQQIIN